MQAPVQTAMSMAENMQAQLAKKSFEDPEFRQKLLADPKGVTSELFGVTIPDNVNIQIHECDKHTFHLTLPSTPELDDEQLEMIAAGLSCCG